MAILNLVKPRLIMYNIGMGKFIDLTNCKFGRLTVLYRGPSKLRSNKGSRTCWVCKCDCGKETIVQSDALRRGITKSCGCLFEEVIKKGTHFTHGMFGTPTYNSWANMVARCTDPKNPSYHKYGNRGVRVCEEWRDFRNFLADMGERPGKEYSLDRIKADGNYEPGNCRWATIDTQGQNRCGVILDKARRRLGLSIDEMIKAAEEYAERYK
jgi:hypothetical protein